MTVSVYLADPQLIDCLIATIRNQLEDACHPLSGNDHYAKRVSGQIAHLIKPVFPEAQAFEKNQRYGAILSKSSEPLFYFEEIGDSFIFCYQCIKQIDPDGKAALTIETLQIDENPIVLLERLLPFLEYRLKQTISSTGTFGQYRTLLGLLNLIDANIVGNRVGDGNRIISFQDHAGPIVSFGKTDSVLSYDYWTVDDSQKPIMKTGALPEKRSILSIYKLFLTLLPIVYYYDLGSPLPPLPNEAEPIEPEKKNPEPKKEREVPNIGPIIPVGADVDDERKAPRKNCEKNFTVPVITRLGTISYWFRSVHGYYHENTYYLDLAALHQIPAPAIRNLSAKTDGWEEVGPLMEHGYSVAKQKGLSLEQRHWILDYVAGRDILEPDQIAGYLSLFIDLAERKKKANMKEAIAKWEKDRDYVMKRQKEKKN